MPGASAAAGGPVRCKCNETSDASLSDSIHAAAAQANVQKLTGLLTIGATLASLGVRPPSAHAQDAASWSAPMGDFTPEHMRPERRLLFGGGALLLGAYGTSALIGAANERKADERPAPAKTPGRRPASASPPARFVGAAPLSGVRPGVQGLALVGTS